MVRIPYKQLRKYSIGIVLLFCVVCFLLLNMGNMDFSAHLTSTGEQQSVLTQIKLDVQQSVQKSVLKIVDLPKILENISLAEEKKNSPKLAPTEPLPKVIPGEELARRIEEKCTQYLHSMPPSHQTFPITTNSKRNLMFCPMCKLASTYWTRFFTLSRLSDNNTYKTPYDIPMNLAPPTKERLRLVRGNRDKKYDSYYKFLFVRDPYSRIISAYIDKLFAPNPVFWKAIGKKIVAQIRPKNESRKACGSDLSFEEYVRAIISKHKSNDVGCVDCHDETFMGACHPCEVKYDFIGKMENFMVDSFHIYRKAQMNNSIDAIKKQGKQLADEDALMDTVNSPFRWKTDLNACVPWRESLNRIWRKLQIRGVIGKQQLPLSAKEADDITKEQFVKLILDTQALTSYADRKQQRTEALIEIYSMVDIKYLNQLKVSFKNDFDFFEYDDDPHDIFHVDRSKLTYYGYLDLH